MTRTHVGRLEVPGASLHYEARGAGPTLLLIHDDAGDADTWAELAVDLATTYRVVTYDRRGHGRSEPVSERDGDELAAHAEDAHWLLEALTDESAVAFGSGQGAAIGLELIARYPGQVRRLVAHRAAAPGLAPEGFAVPDELVERIVVCDAGSPQTQPLEFSAALRRALG